MLYFRVADSWVSESVRFVAWCVYVVVCSTFYYEDLAC